MEKRRKLVVAMMAMIVAMSVFIMPAEADAASYSKTSVKNFKVASKTYNSVTLSWSKKSGTTRYQVYRSTKKSSGYKRVATLRGTRYTNKNIITGKTYYYKVRAYKKSGKRYTYTKYSPQVKVCTTLSTPSMSIKTSSRGLEVSWKGVSGATGYQVYRADGDGRYVKIETTSARYHLDEDAEFGETYSYKVRAYRKVGKTYQYSAYSPVKKGTRKLATPKITVTSNDDHIDVSWSKVPGADGYELYRAAVGDPMEEYATLQGTDFTDTELIRTEVYRYKVRAYSDAGKHRIYGPFCEFESGTTKHPFPSLDENKVATDYYIDYGDVRFCINEPWTEQLNAKINAVNGEQGAAKCSAERTAKWNDKNPIYVYCYDTEDFDNFLMVYVSEGRIIGWKTNADVAGCYGGKTIYTNQSGEPFADDCYDFYKDYSSTIDLDIVSVLAWNEAFETDASYNAPKSFDKGDMVIAGIYLPNKVDSYTTSIRQEEIVAEHMVNALRGAHGITPLEHSDALYGTEEWGTLAYAKTMALSDVCSHKAVDLKVGPCAGTSSNDRSRITKEANGYTAILYRENAAGDWVTAKGGGESLAWAWYTSPGHKGPLIQFENSAGQGLSEVCLIAIAGYPTKTGRAYWAMHTGEVPLKNK